MGLRVHVVPRSKSSTACAAPDNLVPSDCSDGRWTQMLTFSRHNILTLTIFVSIPPPPLSFLHYVIPLCASSSNELKVRPRWIDDGATPRLCTRRVSQALAFHAPRTASCCCDPPPLPPPNSFSFVVDPPPSSSAKFVSSQSSKQHCTPFSPRSTPSPVQSAALPGPSDTPLPHCRTQKQGSSASQAEVNFGHTAPSTHNRSR